MLFAIILHSNGLPLFILQKYAVNIQQSCYKKLLQKYDIYSNNSICC